MWPFTTRRVLTNRWWALAFVGFVCWQIADIAGALPQNAPPASADANDSDSTNAAMAMLDGK